MRWFALRRHKAAIEKKFMKVLLYGINFSPELTGIGKYSGEMANWLKSAGHDVRVITAPPYYPDWKVWPSYRSFWFQKEIIYGCMVIRCPLWVPSSPSGIKRLIHLFSFAFFSIPALFFQWRWRPDVVFVVEPPLFASPGALCFSFFRGTKSWLHVQDFEVDAAFELGLLKGTLARRFVTVVERTIMRSFDRVSTISGQMLKLAERKGVDKCKLVAFPNWVDISSVFPLSRASSYRAELKIDANIVVALYSGNMGGKQGLEILAHAAKLLVENTRILFVFCGNGSGKGDLERSCEGLPNVIFLDLQPLSKLNDLLNFADIHLLPQRADAADLVMPSKLTGMLASGRPVVATARSETELGKVVSGCGVVVDPENSVAFSDAIAFLAADFELRKTLGRAARVFAESELDAHAVLRRFQIDLQTCVSE